MIYERFHDDTSIRDESTSEKFSGPGAGFPHDKIAMRDFIHSHWSYWLKLDIKPPKRFATPEDWRAFRKKVAPAVEMNKPK